MPFDDPDGVLPDPRIRCPGCESDDLSLASERPERGSNTDYVQTLYCNVCATRITWKSDRPLRRV